MPRVNSGHDTVAGAFTDAATSDFLIKGINAGTYTIAFTSTAPYKLKETGTVIVPNDNITEIGEVNLTN